MLERDDETMLADLYVNEGIIPEKYYTDALHIATAAVNGVELLVSMNFRHIVKRKTIKMTGAINVLNGYRAIDIHSPREVIEDEDI